MPRSRAIRTTWAILCVLTWGRSRSAPRAMVIISTRFFRATSRKITSEGLSRSNGSSIVYRQSMVLLAHAPGRLHQLTAARAFMRAATLGRFLFGAGLAASWRTFRGAVGAHVSRVPVSGWPLPVDLDRPSGSWHSGGFADGRLTVDISDVPFPLAEMSLFPLLPEDSERRRSARTWNGTRRCLGVNSSRFRRQQAHDRRGHGPDAGGDGGHRLGVEEAGVQRRQVG